MSSPAFFHEGMSPHAMDGPQDYYEGGESGVVKRPMRVKVLYTIGDATSNMLARLQHTTIVPVVTMEDQTQIGVVQLHTCMQAIISHSPELMPNLEQDYTVYAYDYSEYDTPLVGQGLLSRVLASASPTPNAPANQSGTMITGRVCKNLLAMLSNGVKETLEVKLKLVVVPTKHRSQYDKAMDAYRNTSRGTFDSMDFEMNSTSFTTGSEADYNTSMHNFTQMQPQVAPARSSLGGIDSLHDLLTPQFSKELDARHNQTMSISGGSRPGTPVQSTMPSNNAQGLNVSRPSSRASNRPSQVEQSIEESVVDEGPARKRAKLMQTEKRGRPGFGGQPDSLRVAASTAASIREFRPSMIENPSINQDIIPRAPTPRPAGKRLRPTNVIQGQSSLRRNSTLSENQTLGLPSDGSLYDDAIVSSPDIPSSPPVSEPYNDYRLPAPSSPRLPEGPSFADSGFQSDIATDMLPSDAEDTRYPAERARTCTSKKEQVARWRASKIKNNAKAQWNTYTPSDPVAPPPMPTSLEDMNNYMSHSKALSAMGIRRNNSKPEAATQKSNAAPASSAKKSGKRPKSNAESSQAATSQSQSRAGGAVLPHSENGSTPAALQEATGQAITSLERPSTTESQHSQSIAPPSVTASPPKEQPVASQIAKRPALVSSKTQPIDLTTSNAPVSGPMSVNVKLPPQYPESRRSNRPDRVGGMARSKTWTALSSDFDIGSDADVEVLPTEGDMTGKKQVMSHAANRQATIKRQLKESIANGHAPAFCVTCGNIDTPTWRPFYAKRQPGKVADIPEGDSVHAVHAVEKEAGKEAPDEIWIYKKYSMLTSAEKDDKDFTKMQLCNPCGNYFQKNRVFRPKRLWDKEPTTNDEGGKKSRGSGKNRVRVRSPNALSSDGGIVNAGLTPTADESPSASNDCGIEETVPTDMGPPTTTIAEPELPTCAAPVVDELLARAIQQSPARIVVEAEPTLQESSQHVTPNPVRRLLFPSPRKTGEFKSLDLAAETSAGDKNQKKSSDNADETLDNDKENRPPSFEDHSMTDLFNFSMTPFTSPQTARILAKNLKTPTSSRRSRNALGELPDGTGTAGNASEIANLPITPSRAPRASPGALTPFYKDLLEKFGNSSSPGQDGNIDLQDFFNGSINFNDSTSFNFEGHTIFGSPSQFLNDFLSSEAMLPSDMPMPSSPPIAGQLSANAIEFYEDSTATSGPEVSGIGTAPPPPSEL